MLSHALGSSYIYSPPAQELIASGSKFNSWMRNKLMIMVDEIKIDERRELIEILKPMITDERIQIQAKGADQDMEDNLANWVFFTNYKDAVPINKNGRRYCIIYSALQTKQDKLNAGMDSAYFKKFFKWLKKEGGYEALTYWLLNYDIAEGQISTDAPDTSSYEEALRISRSPVQVIIEDCIGDGLPGFRGGYISVLAALNKVKTSGVRNASSSMIGKVLEGMGYVDIGRSVRPYFQEDAANRTTLFAKLSNLKVEDYGWVQGYGC